MNTPRSPLHTVLFFLLLVFIFGCASGGGSAPSGPPLTGYSADDPLPTLAVTVVVAARESLVTVSDATSNTGPVMTFDVNHASESLLDALVPVMAERGFAIVVDPARAQKLDRYRPKRSEFVDPRTSRTGLRESPAIGAGVPQYVAAVRSARTREAFMDVRGACGGKNVRDGARCEIDVLVLDPKLNELYSGRASGSAAGESSRRANVEAAWKAALARLPAR